MKKILVMITLVILPAAVCGMEVSVQVDSQEIPVFGPISGFVKVVNSSARTVQVYLPTLTHGTLWFEIERDGAVRQVHGWSDFPLKRVSIEMASGQSVFVPFYTQKLEKSDRWTGKNRRWVLGTEGQSRFRIGMIFQDDESKTRSTLYSDWIVIRVVSHEMAERWRELPFYSGREKFLFQGFLHSSTQDIDRLRSFAGSYYHDTYSAYHGGGRRALMAASARATDVIDEEFGRVRDSVERLPAANEMWNAMRSGRTFWLKDDYGDGYWYFGGAGI